MSDLLMQALEILKPLHESEISPISPQGKGAGKSQAIDIEGISPDSPISPQNRRPLDGLADFPGPAASREGGQIARRIPLNKREIGEIREKPAKSVGYVDAAKGNGGEIRGNPEISTTYRDRTSDEWRALYDQRVAARLAEAGGQIARDLAFADCFDLIPKTIWPADRVDILTRAGIPKPATWFVGAPRATRDRSNGEAT